MIEKILDDQFWDSRYKNADTGWDLGEVSPPVKDYVDQLDDKNISILIPGCGNSYEADYLLSAGFKDITIIDIAPTLVDKLRVKYAGNDSVRVILDDFFRHKGKYGLILEQTFFCALDPELRSNYALKMNDLLLPGGKLVGLLFSKEFENDGPPFGGDIISYKTLFSPYFELLVMENCYNSFLKRLNTELFIILRKKPYVT